MRDACSYLNRAEPLICVIRVLPTSLQVGSSGYPKPLRSTILQPRTSRAMDQEFLHPNSLSSSSAPAASTQSHSRPPIAVVTPTAKSAEPQAPSSIKKKHSKRKKSTIATSMATLAYTTSIPMVHQVSPTSPVPPPPPPPLESKPENVVVNQPTRIDRPEPEHQHRSRTPAAAATMAMADVVATTLKVKDLEERIHHKSSPRDTMETSSTSGVTSGRSWRTENTGSNNNNYNSSNNNNLNIKPPAAVITEEDMRRFEKAFKLFDHDGEGFITCGELGRVMRSLGMEASVDELHYMITAADLNHTGTVEFEEFVLLMKTYLEQHHQEEDEDELLKKVFQVFDRTNDGYISSLELRVVMKQLGENLSEEELDSMLNMADTNGDGTVTFEEFRLICASDPSKYQI